MNIYICENTLDGLFSSIFQAYEDRHPHEDNKVISTPINNYELFANYIPVLTNAEYAQRVNRKLLNILDCTTYYQLCSAFLCESTIAFEISNSIYHTVVRCIDMAKSKTSTKNLMKDLTNPYISQIFKCSKRVMREADHLYGFTRFKELQNGILFARIHPENNLITILMDHFDNRFPLESFIIYDEPRDIAALHHPHCSSILLKHPSFDDEAICKYSEDENRFSQLWISFFNSITIESRTNPHLQQQMIPKRFWKDTIELA